MRIKHIFWVVSSQFIYAAELNELLVNAKKTKTKTKKNLIVDFCFVGRENE